MFPNLPSRFPASFYFFLELRIDPQEAVREKTSKMRALPGRVQGGVPSRAPPLKHAARSRTRRGSCSGRTRQRSSSMIWDRLVLQLPPCETEVVLLFSPHTVFFLTVCKNEFKIYKNEMASDYAKLKRRWVVWFVVILLCVHMEVRFTLTSRPRKTLRLRDAQYEEGSVEEVRATSADARHCPTVLLLMLPDRR